jgi:predicted glycosyltransferase
MTARILFYAQHLLGVGHLKRAEILADAMAAAGLDVTVALGGEPMAEVPFRSVRVADLPPAKISGEDFSTLLDASGQPVDEVWKVARAAVLLDLYRRTAPDVVLMELFPFGRRQFRFELLPLLEAIHAEPRRPRVVCSVRDILVAKNKPQRDAEIVAVLRRYFDAVLVHGDPALIPFEATFPAAREIADLIRYTGYVAAPDRGATQDGGEGEVLVSAGGGAVGAPLLLAALEARPSTPLAESTWRFLTGPNLDGQTYAHLAAAADSLTIVERFRPDFSARLKIAAFSISQAGYNTTMDILRAGVPAVVVPYETPAETEQRLRADLLAGKGLLTVLPSAQVSPASLAEAITTTLAKPRVYARIGLDGAAATARLVAAFAAHPRTALLTAIT